MKALVLFVGPTRRYSVALVITFAPPRRRASQNVRIADISPADVAAFHSAISSLPPKGRA